MNDLYCGACGATIPAGGYAALDGSRWCLDCADRAATEAHENYAQEEEVGLVDAHAVVLDVLRQQQDGRSPGWVPPTSQTAVW